LESQEHLQLVLRKRSQLGEKKSIDFFWPIKRRQMQTSGATR
jgi:hypothetical protein